MKGCSKTSEIGKNFALRVMKHLKDTCTKWKEATGFGFSLYGTPAETLCYLIYDNIQYENKNKSTVYEIVRKAYAEGSPFKVIKIINKTLRVNKESFDRFLQGLHA